MRASGRLAAAPLWSARENERNVQTAKIAKQQAGVEGIQENVRLYSSLQVMHACCKKCRQSGETWAAFDLAISKLPTGDPEARLVGLPAL